MLGGISNATFENNIVVNDPALVQGEAGVTISGITVAASGGIYFSKNNQILGNDSRGLLSQENQLEIIAGCDGNICKNNDYGAIYGGLEMAGAHISSNYNTFVNENFWGNYPGYPQAVCMWFNSGALYNTVSALKNGQALQGFDICTQIYFEEGTEPPANTITGYSKCSAVPESVKQAMEAKSAAFIDRKKTRCLDANGTWDDATQTCTYQELP